VMPKVDTRLLTELFRAHVLKMLKKEGLIDEPVEGCLFARYFRYAKKIILGISTICLWLFFSYFSISNKNPSKSTDS